MAAPINSNLCRRFGRLFRVLRPVRASSSGIHTSISSQQKYLNQTPEGQIPTSEFHQKQIKLDERPAFAVDTDLDFTWVDKIIPTYQNPPAPDTPTPSGWVPPTAKFGDNPYYVRRNAGHLLPVYLRESHKKLRKTTLVRHIDGDIWALEKDLRRLLEEKHKCEINTEVNEVSRVVKINGIFIEDVSAFLLEKGF